MTLILSIYSQRFISKYSQKAVHELVGPTIRPLLIHILISYRNIPIWKVSKMNEVNRFSIV